MKSVAQLANGDLVAGGSFTTAGGVAAANIARWDGTAWSSLGSGTNGDVYKVTQLANGDLVAGGSFATAGGVPAANIARWDGTAWSPLGLGTGYPVNSLMILPNGNLLAGGYFSTFNTRGSAAHHLLCWDGTVWAPLTPGFDGRVTCSTWLPNGGLVVGGGFTLANGVGARHVAQWNGTTWFPMGAGLDGSPIALTTLANGNVVAAGGFSTAGGTPVGRIARWNGTSWSPLGTGITGGEINAAAVCPNGDLVVGGSFTAVGGVAASGVARWDGAAWWPLGSGIAPWSSAPIVSDLIALPSGNVVVLGVFSSAGGVAVSNIARWDGTSWSPLGNGPRRPGGFLTARPNGQIVAGGTGLVISGGTFSGVVDIDAWDGTSWSIVGSFSSSYESYGLNALTTLPNGDVAAGGFLPSSAILRWNGTSWTNDPVWRAGYDLLAHGGVYSLAPLPNGDLVVGGDFITAGFIVSPYLARLTTTCPALASARGNGCASSGGANLLVATTLPWLGATFRATGTGLPNSGFVVVATSFASFAQGQHPLATLVLQGVAGCDLLVPPDFVQVVPIAAGVAGSQLALPNVMAFAGLVFHQQMLPVELDATGGILTVTATNALALTVGAF